ncbi:unnamed protein product, partial [Cuscuta epithymum]
MDEEGTFIQATIPLQLIPQLEDKFEEGKLYAIKNFEVKENQGNWRPTPHPYRLFFTDNTKIAYQEDKKHDYFRKSVYKITEFSDIINGPDVVGANLL